MTPKAVAYAVQRDPQGPPKRTMSVWIVGILFLLVGVLIGGAVGVAIGYAAFNQSVQSSKDQPTVHTVKADDNSSMCR